jgi:hypothetical protein
MQEGHARNQAAGHDGTRFPSVDQELRLPLLCRMAKTTFAAIERDGGAGRGSISSANGGRSYFYPRLREAIVAHLAERLASDPEEIRAYLFDPE